MGPGWSTTVYRPTKKPGDCPGFSACAELSGSPVGVAGNVAEGRTPGHPIVGITARVIITVTGAGTQHGINGLGATRSPGDKAGQGFRHGDNRVALCVMVRPDGQRLQAHRECGAGNVGERVSGKGCHRTRKDGEHCHHEVKHLFHARVLLLMTGKARRLTDYREPSRRFPGHPGGP